MFIYLENFTLAFNMTGDSIIAPSVKNIGNLTKDILSKIHLLEISLGFEPRLIAFTV